MLSLISAELYKKLSYMNLHTIKYEMLVKIVENNLHPFHVINVYEPITWKIEQVSPGLDVDINRMHYGIRNTDISYKQMHG